MLFETCNYKVTPRAFQCEKEQTIKIIPCGEHLKFQNNKDYTIIFVPMEIACTTNFLESFDPLSGFYGIEKYDKQIIKAENGILSFTYNFHDEQEWIIYVSADDESPRYFQVYSLHEDLYKKIPLKGDFHAHSNYSDGKEDPAIVAANYRKAGFDFFALTDHFCLDSSLKMINSYKDIDLDFKMYQGEEVHLYSSAYIHIVNFGGNTSINKLYNDNKDKLLPELTELSKSLNLPKNINPLEFTLRKWVSEQIKATGGFSILVHPYWITACEYNMHSPMTEYLVKNNIFDAWEVVSGQTVEENNMQIALYNELRSEGYKVPMVGASDSHGTDPAVYFNTIKSFVFADSNSFDDICNAVKNLFCVGVESMPHENLRLHGPYRLVKYGLFLNEYYFPTHDNLCVEEGTLMKAYILGDNSSKAKLSSLKGNTTAFTNEFFGR